MDKLAEDDVFALRVFAAVQIETARLRRRDQLPVGDAEEKARKLMRDADLIEQGVPPHRVENSKMLR